MNTPESAEPRERGVRRGGCLCGAVRLTAAGVETHHHACHCGMCRRWAGGPLLCAPAEEVSFESTEHLVRFKSSEWAERGFCGRCGSSLFYFLVPAGRYMVAVGCFDDVSDFALAREIFIDHKPHGYAFAGEHQRWTEQQTLAAHAASDGLG